MTESYFIDLSKRGPVRNAFKRYLRANYVPVKSMYHVFPPAVYCVLA